MVRISCLIESWVKCELQVQISKYMRRTLISIYRPQVKSFKNMTRKKRWWAYRLWTQWIKLRKSCKIYIYQWIDLVDSLSRKSRFQLICNHIKSWSRRSFSLYCMTACDNLKPRLQLTGCCNWFKRQFQRSKTTELWRSYLTTAPLYAWF